MVASLMLAAVIFAGAGQQTGSISGVITDTTGRALPGATLTVTSGDGSVGRTTTDASGRYQFAGLRPGRYRIEARMVGFDAKTTDLTVASARAELWSGALLVGPPLGAGSIERRVMGITGSAARDCGRLGGAASQPALQRSLECALASARAGEPFAVIVQSGSDASHEGSGELGESDGRMQVFGFARGGLVFHSEPCPPEQLTVSREASGQSFTFACRP